MPRILLTATEVNEPAPAMSYRLRSWSAAATLTFILVLEAAQADPSPSKTDAPPGRYVLTYHHELKSDRKPKQSVKYLCGRAAEEMLRTLQAVTVNYGPGVLVGSEEWVLDSNDGTIAHAHRPKTSGYSLSVGFFRSKRKLAFAVLWYTDSSSGCRDSMNLYGTWEDH